LCDTNIIIELYKGNAEIINSLKEVGQKNIAISVITAGELIFGARNKKELARIKKDIANLRLIHIDEKVGEELIRLMSTYTLSHGLGIADGFMASSALIYHIPLYTLNKKDFRYIEGLSLYRINGNIYTRENVMKLLDIHFFYTYKFCNRYLKGRLNVPEVMAVFLISIFLIINMMAILIGLNVDCPNFVIQIVFVVIMLLFSRRYLYRKTCSNMEIRITWFGKNSLFWVLCWKFCSSILLVRHRYTA
jgi:tRNA(fMet)-specific endonuclease VapC